MAFTHNATKIKALAICMAAVLGLAALGGCAPSSTANQQQNENRTYMSHVNQVMDDLETNLASFTDAVSRDDVVGMQTQAKNALATLDDLAGIEAPDDLSDVKSGYEEGADKLRGALNDYVALYTEISSATDAQAFDWSTYESRLSAIQESYDEGISKLQEADELAAGKEANDSSQQQDTSQQGDGAQSEGDAQ